MRGADIVAQSLAACGAKTVFALSGNQIMSIFDAALDTDLRLIHTRHEACAVFMAEAYAQLTGDVGVAMVTAGPGFANALSAMYSAKTSETPVILLSGDSPLVRDGYGAFHELDQTTMAGPVTKASVRVMSEHTLGEDLARAISLARSGRPGPVHVALPADVLTAQTNATVPPADAFARQPALPRESDIETLLEAFAASERPVILTGPAMTETRAGDLLAALTDAIDAPVVPIESPRALRDPALGQFADSLKHADLIVSLGKQIDYTVRYGEEGVFPADANVFAVAPDESALEQAERALGSRLTGRIKADADLCAERLIEGASVGNPRDAWRAEVAEALANREMEALPPTGDGVVPLDVAQALQEVVESAGNAIYVADGGEFGQWMQGFVNASRRVMNGVSAAIASAMGNAIGAQIADPDATVICTLGDGTAGFYLGEFDTAVREGANAIFVIGNDACWNAERMLQIREFGADRQTGCDLLPTRYDKAAEGLGAHGEYVTTAEELGPALARARASGKPACINVKLDAQPAPVFAKDAPGAH
ncbi:thiamine pyrophosphate-binding protein [Dichotomicrobium thermohalophilum]|uniref:Acetolactate synthase-1/2/3 large subunit n=1 Tax=Dichotomicrobium thermohalophilum TaxID=933063 RepID=A0A397PDS3_9HYPH|nr:thiamine pyrophosphate-binding protein [Dichotomicrobium thermohalophilum]RIA45375.1 acetolactate synthase-1/2/3 large subunit [Dichotomicrobium thermohalophilum]